MDRKTVPITLFSSFTQTLCESLYKKLKDLGYQDVEILDYNDFSGTYDCQRRVLVLPLNRDPLSNSPYNSSTFLKRIHHEPVLGIIPTSTDLWTKKALKVCNEILYWPCAKEEIDLRIDRTAHLLQDNESLIVDQFLNLNMIGSSPPFLHVLQNIKKFARVEAPVLIEGESGTGKELAARAIHYLSGRRDYPFIPVNSGAIPDNLLENELFGHQPGAFTDAKTSQDGLVCQAEGGTLFLDEVETFSPRGQVVLLRFLEDQQYRTLGSNNYEQADVRIIAATNARLKDAVKQGDFRSDLYYRLYVMSIEMPPLSRRENDMLELANYFLDKYRVQYNQPDKQLHQDSIQWILKYSWPGNVRELENTLHREFLMSEGSYIMLRDKHISQKNRRVTRIDRRKGHLLSDNFNEAKARIISEFERTYLTRLLLETDGNVTWAAKKAGKERRTLGRLLKKHGIA